MNCIGLYYKLFKNNNVFWDTVCYLMNNLNLNYLKLVWKKMHYFCPHKLGISFVNCAENEGNPRDKYRGKELTVLVAFAVYYKLYRTSVNLARAADYTTRKTCERCFKCNIRYVA